MDEQLAQQLAQLIPASANLLKAAEAVMQEQLAAKRATTDVWVDLANASIEARQALAALSRKGEVSR